MKIFTENDSSEKAILSTPSDVLLSSDMKEMNILIRKMREFLERTNRSGLSAPQIGILKSFFLAKELNRTSFRVICNPSIVWHSEEIEFDKEECLSLPEKSIEIQRYSMIMVNYQTLNDLFTGEISERTLFGKESKQWQHFIDHLNGILISKSNEEEEEEEVLLPKKELE